MKIETKHIALGLCSGYILTSALFFIFPGLLRRKSKYTHNIFNQALQGKKILRIAHRGGARLGTQNTVQAFKRCLHVSDCLEMDVCETADNVLVVHHDKDLMRSCGIDSLIQQVKFKDLPKYQDQIKLDFSENIFFPTNNESIPTIQSIFQLFPGIALNIQLKTPSQTAVHTLIQLMDQYDRFDDTIIGIRGKQNSQLKNKFIEIAQKQGKQNVLGFMNDGKVAYLYLSYIFGLLPFIKIQETTFQTPVYSKQFENWFVSRAEERGQSALKAKLGCKILKIGNFLSRPLIWHLKRRGVMTFGWVCNTEQGLERAKQMGVQGIMTDNIYELDNFLKKSKKEGNKLQ